MAKRILLGTAGVVAGLIVGNVVMMGLHMASTLVYAPPEGVSFFGMDPENQERLQEWFATLPAGAFLLAAACHGLGCMAGAGIATLVAGRRSLVPALVVGAIFTLGGIMNLSAIPHPSWFPFLDLPIYLVLAFLAGKLLVREGPSADAA